LTDSTLFLIVMISIKATPYPWMTPKGGMMLTCRRTVGFAVILFFIALNLVSQAWAASCEKVVPAISARLASPIDQGELVEILRILDRTNYRKLPPRFVTKGEARSRGWRPGRDLWSIDRLRGFSIGGDRFRNLEGRLPDNTWREADLDYKGGPRGGKRLVFSKDGRCFVTVDHYRTFVEIPPCR
jgi:hypothetical protein